ncbi:MAG: DUF2625 family protein [Phycisphaerales bacterium]
MARTLDELLGVQDPAWGEVESLITGCPHHVEALAPDVSLREEVLLVMQNSIGSALGAVIWHTGGIVIDQGWLRVLGCGGPRLSRNVLSWADHLGWWFDRELPPGAPVIADDVLGGLFALNWGQIDPRIGINNIFYFAPDRLDWEPLDLGYSAFLRLVLSDRLAGFYRDHRWDGWESEVSFLAFDRGLSVVPPLWTREGKDLSLVNRRSVPIREIVEMQFEFRRQLNGGGDDGECEG